MAGDVEPNPGLSRKCPHSHFEIPIRQTKCGLLVKSVQSNQKKLSQNTQYYQENVLKILAKKVENYKSNPEKQQALSKSTYRANPDKFKAISKKTYRANPDKFKAVSQQNYRANLSKFKTLSQQTYRVIQKNLRLSLMRQILKTIP